MTASPAHSMALMLLAFCREIVKIMMLLIKNAFPNGLARKKIEIARRNIMILFIADMFWQSCCHHQ